MSDAKLQNFLKLTEALLAFYDSDWDAQEGIEPVYIVETEYCEQPNSFHVITDKDGVQEIFQVTINRVT